VLCHLAGCGPFLPSCYQRALFHNMVLGFAGLLSFSLLCLQSLATAQSTREQFASLAASHGGVIKLNSQTFDAITASDRDWSVSIQVTALAGQQVACEPCKQFAPNYDAVASAWKKVPKERRDHHFFASLDFQNGMEIFKRLGINTAPFVYFYPAAKGPLTEAHPNTKMWTYDFGSYSFDPKVFAEQLSPHTPVPIPYTAPINWGLVFTVVGAVAGLFVAYQVFGQVILSILSSRWIWGIASLTFILTMLAGYMFVRIRMSPYAGQVRTQQGGTAPSHIAAGYQNQFGAEIQIVSGLYGVLAASQIALIVFAPQLPSAARQRGAVYIWLAVSWTLFSVLVAIFRIKHSGYPFKLFL